MNAVADDHQQADILDDHQWIMEGPNAYGWVKRSWGKDTEVVVPVDQFDTLPAGVFLSYPSVLVREVNEVKEEFGSLDE